MSAESNKVSNRRVKSKILPEILVVLVLSVAVFLLASRYDVMERIVKLSNKYESLELDEIATVGVFLVFAMLCFSMRRWAEVRKSEALLAQRNADLETALSEIRQLRGIITICSVCKKIKNDEGFWQQLEVYIRDHTEAEFSHGLCKDCVKKLYPEIEDDLDDETEPTQ